MVGEHKMDAETLEALQGSIAKWEAIADGTGIDEGPANCPLCKLFFEGECEGCPVYARTECTACEDTPYEDWVEESVHIPTTSNSRTGKTAAAIDAAKREVAFLRSLLPQASPLDGEP